MKHLTVKQKLAVFSLAILAGFLYNSWPLGYVVNPVITAQHGLASELGAPGQPWWWLFDVLDVVASLLVIWVAALLWRAVKAKHQWFKIGMVSYTIFAVLTIVDALLPLNCQPTAKNCGPIIHNPLLITHGVSSIAAAMALFVSAVALWQLVRVSGLKYLHSVMIIILVGWALFGIISALFLLYPGPGYLAQHYFITLCSIWIALVPFVAIRSTRLETVPDLSVPQEENQLQA